MKIGVMQDTEVLVCFTLDDERDIEWDTLKVYLHDHPEIDITDLMNGRDLTVEHIAAEKEGAFPTFTVRVKPNTSPATTDKEIADKIVNNQKNLKELFTESSYEEMTEALQKWLDPSSEDGTKQTASKPITGATTATKSEDISSAFDSLFNS